MAPNIGDKIVYCGTGTHQPWDRRRITQGLVLDIQPAETGTVLQVWDLFTKDWWIADPKNVRVVERATYTPVPADPAEVD